MRGFLLSAKYLYLPGVEPGAAGVQRRTARRGDCRSVFPDGGSRHCSGQPPHCRHCWSRRCRRCRPSHCLMSFRSWKIPSSCCWLLLPAPVLPPAELPAGLRECETAREDKRCRQSQCYEFHDGSFSCCVTRQRGPRTLRSSLSITVRCCSTGNLDRQQFAIERDACRGTISPSRASGEASFDTAWPEWSSRRRRP